MLYNTLYKLNLKRLVLYFFSCKVKMISKSNLFDPSVVAWPKGVWNLIHLDIEESRLGRNNLGFCISITIKYFKSGIITLDSKDLALKYTVCLHLVPFVFT